MQQILDNHGEIKQCIVYLMDDDLREEIHLLAPCDPIEFFENESNRIKEKNNVSE